MIYGIILAIQILRHFLAFLAFPFGTKKNAVLESKKNPKKSIVINIFTFFIILKHYRHMSFFCNFFL